MEVLDEPLYATFLRVTGVDRPYKKELLSKMVYSARAFSSKTYPCPPKSRLFAYLALLQLLSFLSLNCRKYDVLKLPI